MAQVTTREEYLVKSHLNNQIVREKQDGQWDSVEVGKLEARRAQLEVELDELGHDDPIDLDSYGVQRMQQAAEVNRQAQQGLTPGGKLAYSVADNLSTAPLALIPGVGPALNLTIMGSKAGAQKAVELAEQGVGATEALPRTVLAGLIEAGTEKIGMDNLLSIARNGGKSALHSLFRGGLKGLAKSETESLGAKVAADLLSNATAEGLEEVAGYVANYAVDKAFQDPNASFSTEELFESWLQGALAGLVLGGVGTAVNGVNSQAQQNALRQQQLAQEILAEYVSRHPGTRVAPDLAELSRPAQEMNAVRVLEQETAKGIDTLAAKTQEVMEQESRLPGGQAQELAAMTEPEEYMVRRPLSELEHRAAQWMLEEFKARNQVAYERYASLTKQEQGIIDRWQALEYRLNPPAALVTGNQNGKLSGRNDPYGIIDTRQPVDYDKGKEGEGNELSPAGLGWGQPNRTNPGRPNAYAEYLAYKQKVQARQQSLALEQALQQLFVQEQAARTYAGPQAFAYNGADSFASGRYETGGTSGVDDNYGAGDTFKSSGLDSGAGADRASSVGDTGEATGQVLREGDSKTKAEEVNWKGFNGKKDPETGLSKLQGHYQKHVVEGGEFGDISQNEYLKMAKDFAKESNAGFQEQQIGNLTVKYDPETRRMFIGNLKDREIRTFYRADYRSADPFAAAVEEAIKMINQ